MNQYYIAPVGGRRTENENLNAGEPGRDGEQGELNRTDIVTAQAAAYLNHSLCVDWLQSAPWTLIGTWPPSPKTVAPANRCDTFFCKRKTGVYMDLKKTGNFFQRECKNSPTECSVISVSA